MKDLNKGDFFMKKMLFLLLVLLIVLFSHASFAMVEGGIAGIGSADDIKVTILKVINTQDPIIIRDIFKIDTSGPVSGTIRVLVRVEYGNNVELLKTEDSVGNSHSIKLSVYRYSADVSIGSAYSSLEFGGPYQDVTLKDANNSQFTMHTKVFVVEFDSASCFLPNSILEEQTFLLDAFVKYKQKDDTNYVNIWTYDTVNTLMINSNYTPPQNIQQNINNLNIRVFTPKEVYKKNNINTHHTLNENNAILFDFSKIQPAYNSVFELQNFSLNSTDESFNDTNPYVFKNPNTLSNNGGGGNTNYYIIIRGERAAQNNYLGSTSNVFFEGGFYTDDGDGTDSYFPIIITLEVTNMDAYVKTFKGNRSNFFTNIALHEMGHALGIVAVSLMGTGNCNANGPYIGQNSSFCIMGNGDPSAMMIDFSACNIWDYFFVRT